MPVPSESAPVGSPAPDFQLTAIDGRQVRLSDLRGRPVVLVFLRGFFWPFCRGHLSQLRDRYVEFQRRGAEVLAIAPDTPENARSYFQRHEIPFPCLPDPDRQAYRLYDVKSALLSLGQRPGLFIIDPQGVVRYAYLGWQQWEIPTVDETLRQLDGLTAD